MKCSMLIVAAGILAIGLASEVSAQSPRNARGTDNILEDPVSMGEPLSHWVKVIRDRNAEELGMAFDAIVELGPAASAAVPELTQIVAEPFTPIRLGSDDKREVLSKLGIILMKGDAIDGLGAIGQKAAPSARSVIEWSLTVRVLPPEDPAANALFIDLVTMDVMERMRGAGTVAQFGIGAAPAVQELMESGDSERRKFAVAILNEATLPIVSDLMNSGHCRDRMLGLSALTDMWPVVASSHLDALNEILACSEGDSKSFVGKKTRLPVVD
ncbi:MAG TPA: hypothetical protein VFR05_01375 [Terriglobia bacterium]|nr:hypothetical protein [Terriglobia bacterium]